MLPLFNLTVLLLSLGVARAYNDDDIWGAGDAIDIDPDDYECAKLSDIYSGGEAMCGLKGGSPTAPYGVWGRSFYYERNEPIAYTWWFNDMDSNPNDAATIARGLNVPTRAM